MPSTVTRRPGLGKGTHTAIGGLLSFRHGRKCALNLVPTCNGDNCAPGEHLAAPDYALDCTLLHLAAPGCTSDYASDFA